MTKLLLGAMVNRIAKVILTIIILGLYRGGKASKFLGVGGTWNLNEDKSPDPEILASGVLVGYLIYNISVMVSYCVNREKTANDVVMNVIGTFLWVAVGGTALHYWHKYQDENRYLIKGDERDVGLTLGSLCILNAILHCLDAYIAYRLRDDEGEYGTQ